MQMPSWPFSSKARKRKMNRLLNEVMHFTRKTCKVFLRKIKIYRSFLRVGKKFQLKFPNSVHMIFITLAISKCYGKVRVLFFRATTLISRGNSHVSRVRGLVVRCLLFNPEVSCSNPWVCANFLTSIPKQKVLTFFGTMRLFGFVRLFFRNFLNVPKESSFKFF